MGWLKFRTANEAYHSAKELYTHDTYVSSFCIYSDERVASAELFAFARMYLHACMFIYKVYMYLQGEAHDVNVRMYTHTRTWVSPSATSPQKKSAVSTQTYTTHTLFHTHTGTNIPSRSAAVCEISSHT